jgi:hypothetical protein
MDHFSGMAVIQDLGSDALEILLWRGNQYPGDNDTKEGKWMALSSVRS